MHKTRYLEMYLYHFIIQKSLLGDFKDTFDSQTGITSNFYKKTTKFYPFSTFIISSYTVIVTLNISVIITQSLVVFFHDNNNKNVPLFQP